MRARLLKDAANRRFVARVHILPHIAGLGALRVSARAPVRDLGERCRRVRRQRWRTAGNCAAAHADLVPFDAALRDAQHVVAHRDVIFDDILAREPQAARRVRARSAAVAENGARRCVAVAALVGHVEEAAQAHLARVSSDVMPGAEMHSGYTEMAAPRGAEWASRRRRAPEGR